MSLNPESTRVKKKHIPAALFFCFLVGWIASAPLQAGEPLPGDRLLFPLPAGKKLAQSEERLRLSWQLRLPSPTEKASVRQDQDHFWVFLTLTPTEQGAYTYAPFASGLSAEEIRRGAALVLPTRVRFLDQEGRDLPEARYYYPPGTIKKDLFSGLALPVYADTVTIPTALPIQRLGQTLTLSVEALLCTERTCMPFRKTYDLTLASSILKTDPFSVPDQETDWRIYREPPFFPLTEEQVPGVQPNPRQENSAETADGLEDYYARLSPRSPLAGLEVNALGRAMLLGLAAGFILNFMPCVLPVISLKLGGIVGLGGWESLRGQEASAKARRRRVRLYACCFCLGVFVWFGLILAAMGLTGQIWGQFFQSRNLILGLTLLLFVLALGMFGLLRLPFLRLEIDPRASLPYQAFLSGLLATLLATPCSGPLLGGVLGWAVNQPLPYLGLTLGSVAAGMAAPFLILAVRPELGRRLPRSGSWNQILESFTGFLLLATVLYLLTLLPREICLTVLASFLILALCAWIRRLCPPQSRSFRAGFARSLTLMIALGALALPFIPRDGIVRWNNFDPGSFRAQLGRNNLLLEFTADWCINCRAMEMTTLSEDRLRGWSREYTLSFLKVDLTSPNPAGERLLQALGSASIPFLAIIPANNPDTPTILRDLVTPGQLDQALRQTLGK